MEEIIEQYGITLLQIIGGAAVLGLWMELLRPDGILGQICQNYMSGICG